MSVIAAVDKCLEHRHHPSFGISFSLFFFLVRMFVVTLYHGNVSFIGPREAKRSTIWIGIVSFCNARGLKWGLSIYIFFLFWLNKQPCFWKAGSSVSLCTKRATKLKQQQWTAVCQVCENIYFCIIFYCWMLAGCRDSMHKCNIGICLQQRQKYPLKLSFAKDSSHGA